MSSRLYYTSAAPLDASKKTVVFLHAAFMSLTTWVDQMTYLAPKFPDTNLLLIDVNGHGKTTEVRKTFNLYDQCHDIAALMVPTSYLLCLIPGSIVHLLRCLRRYLCGILDQHAHGIDLSRSRRWYRRLEFH